MKLGDDGVVLTNTTHAVISTSQIFASSSTCTSLWYVYSLKRRPWRRNCNALKSYLGVHRFEFQSEHRGNWSFPSHSSAPAGKFWDTTRNSLKPWKIPSKSFPTLHSPDIPPFGITQYLTWLLRARIMKPEEIVRCGVTAGKQHVISGFRDNGYACNNKRDCCKWCFLLGPPQGYIANVVLMSLASSTKILCAFNIFIQSVLSTYRHLGRKEKP
jgi:hypothetical protein